MPPGIYRSGVAVVGINGTLVIPMYSQSLPFETAPQMQPGAFVAEIMSNMRFDNIIPDVPPPALRMCGACGSRGKCTEVNGHKGKHVAVSGFRWF